VSPEGEGLVVGLTVVLDESGTFTTHDRVDEAMRTQVEVGLEEILSGQGARYGMEWSLPFEGSSIGLAISVGALVARRELDPDPLTAATGRIDVGGRVAGVDGVPAKLRAAAAAGMRRVVLPEENRTDAAGVEDLELLFVSEVKELVPVLRRVQQVAHQMCLRGDRRARVERIREAVGTCGAGNELGDAARPGAAHREGVEVRFRIELRGQQCGRHVPTGWPRP
jgi:hypothetical protein